MADQRTGRDRLRAIATELRAIRPVVRAGMLGPAGPRGLARMGRALRDWGPVGGAITVAAVRAGDRPGLIDEHGSLTFSELDDRSTALADALLRRGLPPGTGVGVMCRNHRWILDATFGLAKAGLRAVYLNTDFAGPQVEEVCAREGVTAIVADADLIEAAASADAPHGRFTAWSSDGEAAPGTELLEALIAEGDPAARPEPERHGSIVILTSGTTGTPKGANREQGGTLAAPGALFSKVPFRPREAVYIAPPIFHALGLSTLLLTVATGSTVVTARRFDPRKVLQALTDHGCTGLVAVPVMLNRLVLAHEAGAEDGTRQPDLSGLRFILVSGAQLEAALARRATEAFGDVLHNLYGSTEVAYATIATPEDLRAAPGCAGRPPLGTVVKILDDDGREVPQGRTGRIFVGNGIPFDGYTGGGSKEVIDGLMATGDVGRFDDGGRLFVDGRDDEMIVSGGENVFPREIEELLAAHPAVLEVAAVGVPDPEWGQRLVVHLVRRDGAELTEDEVRDHVRVNLARYKVPREVRFVDELPRNPAGKILKRTLTGD
jgi:fatty-acyl-CoA synthase